MSTISNIVGLIPMISNGHGGIINGVYQTKGKRSPDYGSGVIYEGFLNRILAWKVMYRLYRLRTPFFYVTPESEDISHRTRVDRADSFWIKNNKRAYLLEIHLNAGGGTGIEGFTSVGDTKADPIMTEFLNDLKDNFGEDTSMRFDYSDDDPDKERNYNILHWTECPAGIIEFLFMDMVDDYRRLLDENVQNAFADSLAGTMARLYLKGLPQ